MYIQVVVNVPGVDGVFDYHLPADLENLVKPGCLVIIPFGRQTVQGVVLAVTGVSHIKETRTVTALVDSEPVFTPMQMELARWMSQQTMTPLAQCFGLMLPPGLSQQADTLFTLDEERLQILRDNLTPFQQRMIALLRKRGELRSRQIDAAFPHIDWKVSAQSLIRKGVFKTSSVLNTATFRPKTVKTVQIACPPEIIEQRYHLLGRGEALKRRQKILSFLEKQPWGIEAGWVYAASGGNLQDLYRLEKEGLVSLSESEIWRDPLQQIEWVTHQAPILTSQQNHVWQEVKRLINKASSGEAVKPVLLHGVTGSGKTEIYLQAVAETLQTGRQAIVLTPEISLTPQVVRRFMARFPGKVGLVHSRLSAGERYDTWRRARSGLLSIIIGPRSALFSPLPDVGLMIVDEFDDESYYQNEGTPRYHAVKTAINYGEISHSVIILGSATPDISLMYQARTEKWNLLSLPERIFAHRHAVEEKMSGLGLSLPELQIEGEAASLPLPEVEIVDMRQELKSGNRSIFSRALQRELKQVIENKQQAILYLNRRGSATYVFCRNCGYSMQCPNCEMPLTFHRGISLLLCHNCNYSRKLPKACPQCGSDRIRHYGMGTEKVEQEILDLFPEARVIRWDAETARQKDAHEVLMSHFVQHRADIFVGTQMLAKGIDVPLVTLVGMVLADVGLNFPDYRASERIFQLLTQVAGRAGRSPLGGRAILQTFQPDHYAIQAAALHDYERFYNKEIEYRRKLRYPPFYRLARLEFRHRRQDKAREYAESMARQLVDWINEGEHVSSDIIGPVPCYFAKLNGMYRWQVILRSPDPLLILKGRIKGEWRVEIDPPSIL